MAKTTKTAVRKFKCTATANGRVVIGLDVLEIKGHHVIATNPAHIEHLSRPGSGFIAVDLDATPRTDEDTTPPPMPPPTVDDNEGDTGKLF